jgi:hypothetical protein
MLCRSAADMPRETVHLNISSAQSYEAGALFFAVLAYPAANDEQSRQRFWLALCRQTIIDLARRYGEFAGQYQQIRPAFFIMNDKDAEKTYKAGMKRIGVRLFAAHRYGAPFLQEQLLQRRVNVGGLKTTVSNMASLAAADLGWSDGKKKDGEKNVLHRIFVPSKPVLHAAVALKVLFQTQLPGCDDAQKIGEVLVNKHNLKVAVEHAEDFRQMIHKLENPAIKDEETIKFVLS